MTARLTDLICPFLRCSLSRRTSVLPQRPLLLKGHHRPLTCVKYNSDSDLLFTCGKDGVCSVWWTHNGVRLGTYDGHEGAIWDCAVDFNSEKLLTGGFRPHESVSVFARVGASTPQSAVGLNASPFLSCPGFICLRFVSAACSDRTVKMWDVQSGKALQTWRHSAVIRNVDWARGAEMFVCSQDNTFNQTPTIFFYKKREDSDLFEEEPFLQIKVEDTERMTKVLFSGTNDYVVVATEEGYVRTYDVQTGEMLQEARVHKKKINSLQWSHDFTMLTTASSDMTACILDPQDLSVVRRFDSNRPLNGCVMSPISPHALLGGGQEAISVTMTRASAGHFEVDFFSAVYGKYLDCVEGHFGPVNSLAVAPDGRSFASGSEDGYIRLHHFDSDYLDKYGRGGKQ